MTTTAKFCSICKKYLGDKAPFYLKINGSYWNLCSKDCLSKQYEHAQAYLDDMTTDMTTKTLRGSMGALWDQLKVGTKLKCINTEAKFEVINVDGDTIQLAFLDQPERKCEPIYRYNLITWNVIEILDEAPMTREAYFDRQFQSLLSTTKQEGKTMSLVRKFKELFVSEPTKSFAKLGVVDSEGHLTSEGYSLLLNWLLTKHGDEFKKEVVDKLLEEKEKECECK